MTKSETPIHTDPAPPQGIINLGYLDDLEIKAATCPFCRLVIKSSQNIGCQPPDHKGRLQAGVKWRTWNLPKHSTSYLILYLGVTIFQALGRLLLLADDAPVRLGFARKVEQGVDFRLLRCWMRYCRKWHGPACDSLVNTTSARPWDSKSFRLIDVHNQCLVLQRAPCRYIALSYVWGGIDSLSTIKLNVPYLEQPGALAPKSEWLPRTISDAIHLVEQLGERYLWVDRLCIVQDDEESKMQEIERMDKIYGNAFLAIIAATGDDADAGLSGLRTARNPASQVIEEISPGLRLVFSVAWEAAIQGTKYESRAWTYVSPRLHER